ncbi:tRNA lysidine(34) synthetase TilS [Pseudaminobacter arsenicus]|uniref:tRNA(Ile)-lysidine synthase n=1 Tax=Borborobacter arsenicus TaxID=1851146 RepID=A0A432V0H7_9HYPH|nr:tRNA lysidine(34) synthetase TilS [Pseudaminobacter arsenicus]RUM95679.1 tRNA lysidine(34) synthetase TilS [Pseudaminobacter arsenicus]
MPGASTDPLHSLSRLDLAHRSTVIVAVSGGSDSTALLLLTKEFLDRNAPATRLVAVTVDHRLREGSAAEAAAVARLAARHGIAHRTLCWNEAKPASGIAAAARMARYELLAQAARAEGTDVVLTGHTADDQAETVLMRAARGDGDRLERGLAGMAKATLFDGSVWVVRPLLGYRREALRNFLLARDVTWIEDPTNANETYERPRLRAALGRAGGDDRHADALRTAREAASRRERLGGEAAELITVHADLAAPGLVRLSREFVGGGGSDGALYALRILLASVGGTPHLPDEARCAQLLDRLNREWPLAAAKPLCATLSRVAVEARRDGLFLRRELRDLPQPVLPQDGMLWDGRFRLRVTGETEGLSVAPLGPEAAEIAELYGADVAASLVRAGLSTLPCLWRGQECLSLLRRRTVRQGIAAVPVAAPFARFLPSFDLAAARAIMHLLRAALPPDPPLKRH